MSIIKPNTPSFFSFLLLAVIFLFFTSPAHAAGYGLSINPPLLRVNIKPGKTITQVFTINNLTSDDKLLIARVIPFTEADDRGNPVIDLKNSASWLNYFSLANASIKLGTPFTVKGNSSEQLILSLTIPETSPLRDLYATLLVTTYSNILDVGYEGTLISATIGSNMIITVHSEISPPTILKVGSIFPASGSYFKIGNLYFADNITPMTFSVTIINDGDFTAESKGIFRISNRQDNPVYLDGILPVNIISGTERRIFNNAGNDFSYSPGLGQIGSHKVTIQIKTDNSNAENSISVFFFPFKISLGLFLALVVLGTIVKVSPKNSGGQIDTE